MSSKVYIYSYVVVANFVSELRSNFNNIATSVTMVYFK